MRWFKRGKFYPESPPPSLLPLSCLTTITLSFSLLLSSFSPDICPSELVKVASVLDSLKSSHPSIKITPIFVTVDPARDSIKSLREYGKDFHPDIRFLTGTPEMVKAMAKSYRVYVSKADEVSDRARNYYENASSNECGRLTLTTLLACTG